ncbi:MAG: hypothetical protein QOG20_4728 [Pseudonocardiales bacterium]|nr:hypothetical protein [Pseudonocardiales bacterium]
MPSYPAGFTMSNHALITLADALRARRSQLSTRWRRLTAGRQALLVLAHLRKGETYADLATGFGIGIGTTTVFRYVQEALEVLAALAPSLRDAVAVAVRKTFVILDGTLLRIDRVGMGSGRDRPYFSGGVGDDLDATPWVLCFPEPGARHDMGAAREHGILDALTTAGVRVIADNGYRGSGFAVPQRRRAADPETGERRRLSRNQKAVNSATPANAAPVNGPTPC